MDNAESYTPIPVEPEVVTHAHVRNLLAHVDGLESQIVALRKELTMHKTRTEATLNTLLPEDQRTPVTPVPQPVANGDGGGIGAKVRAILARA